jgi:hypothetical protein
MRGRFALVALLAALLLSVVAFAHASPPDWTWQVGVYDEADFDDVIDFLVSLSAATPDAAPEISLRAPLAGAAVVVVEPGDLPPRRLLPDDTRSPPPA